jgi:hypothetical protein
MAALYEASRPHLPAGTGREKVGFSQGLHFVCEENVIEQVIQQ